MFGKLQVIQEDYDRLVIKYVPGSKREVTEVEKADIINRIRLVMGDSCKVRFIEVTSIPNLPNGKFQYTHCKLRNCH